MSRLGQGQNIPAFYVRGGAARLATIEKYTSLEYGRAFGMSTATLTVPVGSHGPMSSCCGVLGALHTWGHELVVFRDGARPWEGPIVNIRHRKTSVTITAWDVLGWLARAKHPGSLVTAATPVVDLAAADVAAGFASNTGVNVLPYLQVIGSGTGPAVTRDVRPSAKMVLTAIDDLAKSGLYVTAVGRRIALWPHTTTIGRLPALIPEKHMATGADGIEAEEDGLDLAGYVTALTDDGFTGTAGTLDDPFYGRVEGLLTGTALDPVGLNAAANAYRQQHYPAPLRVNVPGDSILSCDAPYALDHLVPGVVIPVRTDSLCRPVNDATQVLSAVKVVDGPSGERVSVTLTPVSAAAA